MALTPLATATDLLDRGVDVTEAAAVNAALLSASAAVRDAAGQAISQVTSTIQVPVPQGQWLDLPVTPVTAVAAVVDESAVAVTGWKLLGGRLWRSAGWGWTCEPAELTVTLTHGLSAVPDDIVQLVCDLAAAQLLADEPHDHRVTSEAIDDSRTSWAEGAPVSITELPERTRLMLARRFGGGAYVTGSR